MDTTDNTPKRKDPAAVSLGRRGGKKLAATRGPDYFRNLQARRKTHKGGNPKRTKKV